MPVMCNNSFIIHIKTEGYALDKKMIETMLKKRFGKETNFLVQKYMPPNPKPKRKVYPESPL